MPAVDRSDTLGRRGASISVVASKCQLRGESKVDTSWRRLARDALDGILPPCCIVCGQAGARRGVDLCEGCAADLPVLSTACTRCAAPLGANAPMKPVCGRCLRRPPPFEVTVCAFRYGWPIHHLLRALKYRHALEHARVLGQLLAAHLASHGADQPDLLCPVPLGPVRYRDRGFNQAVELGRVLERALAIPLRTDLITRVRETSEQSALAGPARLENVRGAFRALRCIDGAHVALVDDVVTTGSTAGELARVLLDAGARRVDVWAVARTCH
jgi:ComF family protein